MVCRKMNSYPLRDLLLNEHTYTDFAVVTFMKNTNLLLFVWEVFVVFPDVR